MRIIRPHLTIRRLMISIVVMGLILGYGERWRRYKRLAEYHRDKASESGFFNVYHAVLLGDGRMLNIESNGHMSKSREYEYAAPRPWVFVSPEVRPIETVEPERDRQLTAPGASPFETPN